MQLQDHQDGIRIYPVGRRADAIVALVEADRIGRHSLAPDTRSADVILVIEPGGGAEMDRLAHSSTVVIYSAHDRPYAFSGAPGIFPSMPRRKFDARIHRAARYLKLKNVVGPTCGYEPPLLFSFVGSAHSIPVRQRICAIQTPDSFVRDTSAYQMFKSQRHAVITDPAAIERQRTAYAEVMQQSKFILCPRGVGTSSFRLFETLHAGRVPVIVSDEWVSPAGPDWDLFSIRVPESSVEAIPAILRSYEADWPDMARRAREAWEAWFADDVLFHHLAESCLSILRSSRVPGAERKGARWRSVFRRIKPVYGSYGDGAVTDAVTSPVPANPL